MITVFRYGPDGRTLVTGGEELLAHEGPVWIDVEAPSAEEMAALAQRYGLHRLAVEDTLHLDQRPKLEEYPNHLFLVMQGFTHDTEDACDLTLHEMHVFLTGQWVITVHERPSAAVSDARSRMEKDPAGTFGRGMDFVAYLVCDALVDRNFPMMDAFSDELEDLETHIFEKPDNEQLQRIFELKRTLVTVRRVLSPQRDVVSLLSRRGTPHIQDRTTLYFRDIYDHLVRLYEQIDAARDLVGNAMDGYLSMVANHTNDITKRLTIFATIFLPLSFITGFFGQNFHVLTAPALFWVMMGTIVTLPIVLLVWFRKQRWL